MPKITKGVKERTFSDNSLYKKIMMRLFFWIILDGHNPKSSLHAIKPIKVSCFCKKATWPIIIIK